MPTFSTNAREFSTEWTGDVEQAWRGVAMQYFSVPRTAEELRACVARRERDLAPLRDELTRSHEKGVSMARIIAVVEEIKADLQARLDQM